MNTWTRLCFDAGGWMILRAALTSSLVWAQQTALPAAAEDAVDFAREVEPIFRERCHLCHGSQIQQNGLRLDRGPDALRGGYSGLVIKPGDSAGSPLIQRVAGVDPQRIMPPVGDPLSAREIGVLRGWIDAGAQWPGEVVEVAEQTPAGEQATHWAFRPVRRPEVSSVRKTDWINNPIDAFILAKLENQGLTPSPEASTETLLRRTYLDLIGLPPSPEQQRAFFEDAAERTLDRLVDRLLRSPHFGERWAIPWLDQVRYADSDGYEKDSFRPHAWRYRQWVIDALNRDMPFNQFTIEQIAGDLLPRPTVAQRVATGFYRNTLKNREVGASIEQYRYEETIDRTNTIATTWLALSVECAQCHNHRYDPISQQEYFELFAFLNDMDEIDIHAPMPGEMGPYLATKAELNRKRQALYSEYEVRETQRSWEGELLRAAEQPGLRPEWDVSYDALASFVDNGHRILRTPWDQRTEQEEFVLTEWFLRNYSRVTTKEEYKATGFREAVQRLHELVDEYPVLSQARTVEPARAQRKNFIHLRGVWDDLGVEVSPDTLDVLPSLETEGAPTRLDLARWLVSPSNPLTARVVVNRIWQKYFGRGLVATVDNFGSQGEEPSHPKLLDWLASELIESGWSLKRIHRLIATSSTYRQASITRPELTQKDPDNRLFARQQRLRLPAELIRDSALSSSGLLNPDIGGRSVRPPQPQGVTNLGFGSSIEWEESAGMDRYRRGLYIHYQRTVPYPFLANFDVTERNKVMCSRERSNTPLQALNLLNDPVFFEMAQGLAARVLIEVNDDSFSSRLRRAFRLCLAREPEPGEQEDLLAYYIAQKRLFEEGREVPDKWFPAPLAGVTPEDAAAWVGVARVLLNLDEFITRE